MSRLVIDHRARTITGRVELAPPGPCPHSHVVREPVTARIQRSMLDDTIVAETTQLVPRTWRCIGRERHWGDHIDSQGRAWPAKHKERRRRR